MKRQRLWVVNCDSLGFWLAVIFLAAVAWLGEDGRQALIAWLGRGCA